jgi:hypothetical protein
LQIDAPHKLRNFKLLAQNPCRVGLLRAALTDNPFETA